MKFQPTYLQNSKSRVAPLCFKTCLTYEGTHLMISNDSLNRRPARISKPRYGPSTFSLMCSLFLKDLCSNFYLLLLQLVLCRVAALKSLP